LTVEAFQAAPCWIGVDLAEIRDIAALIALFKIDAEAYAAIGRFYLPHATIQRSPVAQYSGWVRSGHLIETDGDQADYARIEEDIVAWTQHLNVQEIDFDRALAAQMQQSLQKRLGARPPVITVTQSVTTMNPAMQCVERLVLKKGLQHDANPVMDWMISNVVVDRNYKDEIFPRKAGGKDSPNKIDGPVALFTCLSQAMIAVPPSATVGAFVV
jgi:phage terminase large subunit-like protein